MFNSEHEPLALLVELAPKHAKKRFREEIYKAWNYQCAYCEDQATSLDHVVPRFRSGSSNRHNLIPCCKRCNASKASYPMEQWYQKQEFFTQVRMDRIKNWIEQDVISIFVHCKNNLDLAI